MTANAEAARITVLLEEASLASKAGNLQGAATSLREANSLDPQNEEVQDALDGLRKREAKESILDLCEKYVRGGEEDVGRQCIEAVKIETISTHEANQLLHTLLSSRNDRSLVDKITGSLLDKTTGQKCMAVRLKGAPTETFRDTSSIGDETLNGVIKTLVNPSAWENESDRNEAEKMLMMLSLASILRPGSENKEGSMRTLARLMAVDGPQLYDLIDEENLEIILDTLDVQKSLELRSQATLAASKYLEAAGDKGQSLLTEYVVSRIQRHNVEDLTAAFSAAAALFPVVPSVASGLFLGSGFTDDLLRILKTSQSKRLQHSALELLSASCIDKNCREVIVKHFSGWLEEIMDHSDDERNVATAALVLSKTSAQIEDATSKDSKAPFTKSQDLVDKFQNMILKNDEDTVRCCVEGLAYMSVKPRVKEKLANDTSFLKTLLKLLTDSQHSGMAKFGGLTILSNLTAYPAILSAEQKRMAQLKAYANQSKPEEPNPLENNDHVDARCRKVIEAGLVPLLLKCAKQASATVLGLIATISSSLAKVPKHCGVLVQQGIFDLVLALAIEDAQPTALQNVRQDSARALARILRALDPALIFNSPQHRAVEAAIRGLSTLLQQPGSADVFNKQESDDLYPVFEALQALTNLAVLGEKACDSIITKCWSDLDRLITSGASAIRQATAECMANLAQSQRAADALSKKESNHLLLQLVALMADPAQGSRHAASAALAHLAAFETGTNAILSYESSVREIKLAYESALESGDEGLKIRVVAVINGMASHGEQSSDNVKSMCKKEGWDVTPLINS